MKKILKIIKNYATIAFYKLKFNKFVDNILEIKNRISSFIEKIKLYFIEILLSKPIWVQFLYILLIPLVLEIVFTIPYLIYEKSISVSQKNTPKIIALKNNNSLFDFIKINKKNIKSIELNTISENNVNVIVYLKEPALFNDKINAKNNIVINFDKNVTDSNIKIITQTSNIKYIVKFNNFQYMSILMTYEKMFIKYNIKYYWKFPNKVSNENDYFFITKFYMSHSFQIGLIIFFIFLFEKQGFFGNKEKYSIVYPFQITTDFKDLIGMEEIKKEIYILLDLINNRDKYKEFGIDKGFNYIFSGPPGTGKTKIAGGLSKLLNVPMIVGTGNVETGFINGGVSVIKELFETARLEALNNSNKMAIIFLDEAQTLLVKRGQNREKWADDSANELLAQLDGIHTNNEVDIIFIAASNFDDKNHEFDEAMMRRFKKKLFFRLPNFDERLEIIKFYVNKINKKYICKNIDYGYLADITSNTSPAILESMVQEASLLAITSKKDLINDKNTGDHYTIMDTKLFEIAFERITIGHTDRKTTKNKEKYRNIISKHELGHFICNMQNILNHKFSIYPVDENSKYTYLKDLNTSELKEAISYLKKNLSVLKISIESISQINALGYVLNKNNDILLMSRNELEEEIISLYGGLSSEELFSAHNGDITTGSSNDIEKVSQIFNTMVNKLGMYSNNKINFKFIDTVDNKEENLKLILDNSERLYGISKLYVKEYSDLILALNEELLDKYVLNLDEILSIIEKFYLNKNGDI